MHKALQPRDDIEKLYVSRKEDGTGLANIQDRINALIQRIEDYMKKSVDEGWLLWQGTMQITQP